MIKSENDFFRSIAELMSALDFLFKPSDFALAETKSSMTIWSA
jgi:hypothetical protein